MNDAVLEDDIEPFICECGASSSVVELGEPSSIYSDAHQTSYDHVRGVMGRLDDDGWEAFIDTIENGLGWANSEGMGTGQRSDAEMIAMVRDPVSQYRLGPEP